MNRNEKLIYKNEQGQQIEFSIWSPFFIEEIEGLSNIKNEVDFTKSVGQDGTTYVDSTYNSRNIILQGIITEYKDINRKRMLNTIKKTGTLYYKNKDITRVIKCVLENIVVNEKNKFQISLICPNPFWKDITETETNLVSWIPNLEFANDENYIDFFHTEQTPNYWLETQEVNNFNLINNSKNIMGHNCNLTSYSSYNNINTNLIKTVLPNRDNNFGIKLIENIDISGKDGYFTLSFYYRSVEYNSTRNMLGYIEVKYKDSSLERFNFSNLITDLREDKNKRKWNKLEFTFKTNINKKVDSITRFYFHADFIERDTCVEITNVKLEQGNKATEYTCSKDESAFEEFQSEFGHGTGQEWGYRELKEIVEINNTGDVKCPIRVVFRADSDVEKPFIQNIKTYELIRINKTLKAGDVLEITTGYGNKNVFLNGKKAHQYLDFLNSSWLQLKPGVNLIKYGAEKGLENLECTIFYTPLYLGV